MFENVATFKQLGTTLMTFMMKSRAA